MPVVTITTFHDGVSGVASRSRFTTPTRSGSLRIASAIGRMPSVLPTPVPATMPKPCPPEAQLPQLRAVLPLEQRVEVQAEGELDRLARGARRGDHDDPARADARRGERLRDRVEGDDRGRDAWRRMNAAGEQKVN